MKITLVEVMMVAVLVVMAALVACNTFPTQQAKIAAACEGIAGGVEMATAAKQAGRITKDQLQQVVDVADGTTKFCDPVPVDSLEAGDYAALIGAAARIEASPGVSP